MNDLLNKERLKIVGLYILAILFVLRVVVIPLHSYMKGKALLYSEYELTYKNRLNALEHHRKSGKGTPLSVTVDNELIKKLAYSKDTPYTDIQSDIIEDVVFLAEKKGLTVVNFEMPEVTPGKGLTMVTATIRFRGEPKVMNELIEEIEGWQKRVYFKQFDTTRNQNINSLNLTLAVFRMER